MKEVFLAQLCDFWCLFEQEAVQKIVNQPCTLEKKQGRLWLQEAEGETVELCPLELLLNWPQPENTTPDHFLVLRHADRTLALPMYGPGRACVIRSDTLRPLPAAFGAISHQMLPGVLVNGNEAVMQLNLGELIRATDKIAYLRKKKLLMQQKK